MKVGVVALGPDAAQAAELQRDLEGRVAALPDVVLARSTALAVALGAASSPMPSADPRARESAAKLLQEGVDLYYADKFADALERFAAAAAIHASDPAATVPERVRVRLWRASAFLALEQVARADEEARLALRIAPDVVVDRSEFRPRLAELVERLRTSAKIVTVSLADLPPNAVVRVDGRTVTESAVRLLAGNATFSVSAPGYRALDRTVDLKSDARLSLPLALDASAVLREQLSAATTASGPAKPSAALTAAVQQAGIEWLLVAAPGRGAGTLRGALVSSESASRLERAPATRGGTSALDALVGWAASVLRASAKSVAAVATPVPTSVPLPPPEPASPFALATRWGAATSLRLLAVRDDRGIVQRAAFQGIGPCAALEIDGSDRVRASVELEQIHYPVGSLRVRFADGSRDAVTGGVTNRIRAEGLVRSTPAEWPVRALAGLALERESHASDDVHDPGDGRALGLLPSSTRTVLEVVVRGSWQRPLRGAALVVDGDASLAPFGRWSELPSGNTGDSPRAALDVSATVRARVERPRGAGAEIALAHRMRTVRFSGEGSAPIDPPFEDATREETIDVLRASLLWRF